MKVSSHSLRPMSWQSHLQGLLRSVRLSRWVRTSKRERSNLVSLLCDSPRWLRFLKLSPKAPGKPHRLHQGTCKGNKINCNQLFGINFTVCIIQQWTVSVSCLTCCVKGQGVKVCGWAQATACQALSGCCRPS